MKNTPSFCALILLVGLSLIKEAKPKRILAVEFIGSKSHVITYLSLLEELVQRGHEVTILGPGKGLTKEKRIRDIFTFDVDTFWKEQGTNPLLQKETGEHMNPFPLITTALPKYCREIYDLPIMNELLKESFDLVLLQPLLNDCSLGFIYQMTTVKNSTPLVLFVPLSASDSVVELLGGYYPSSFVSKILLGFSDDMNFYQRFVNFGTNVLFDVILSWYYLPMMEAIYREKVGADTPSAKEILSQASLILSNGHFSTSRPKPNLPNVVDVGGIHSREALALPSDLEDFVAKAGEHGFIFFSLGSSLRGDLMSEKKRSIFVNVFSKLKQSVIWKYETNIPNLPPNVYLSKWMPQQDLLGHKGIRMFITHCGGGSIEEAIYHGTPVLGMPLLGDQPLNARTAENYGYLVRLDWNELSEESLMTAINEILDNPKYRENVQRLSHIFRDQIDRPLDRGVYWLEYIMRHNGAPHLQTPARHLNRFQYHSVDVMTAYLAIILTILYIFIKLFNMLLFLCGFKQRSALKQKTS